MSEPNTITGDFFPAFPPGREGETARAHVVRLQRRALQIGGDSFQVPWYMNDNFCRAFAVDLIHNGTVVPGDGAKLRRMKPSRCFENAVAYALKHDGYLVVHGLALSAEDGCWRYHAWCVGRRGDIIETTCRRTVYFGVPLVRDHFTKNHFTKK